MKGEASGFSLVTAWMLQKPKHDETEPEHSKTPSPTEIADSSQGSEKPEDNTPAEVVDCTAFDYEYYFEQNASKENDSSDDDDLATDEAAAMAELVQEASLANTTLQVLLEIKRKREEPEPTGPTESEAELV